MWIPLSPRLWLLIQKEKVAVKIIHKIKKSHEPATLVKPLSFVILDYFVNGKMSCIIKAIIHSFIHYFQLSIDTLIKGML